MFSLVAVSVSALAIGSGLAGIPAAPVSAATAPAPPFSECPAIGQSPSCEILLVVNADGSVSVANDPSVGPYDGSDDTLVGIINDSAAPVNAVTVSGPGSGLAGFDGDGICSGDYGSWNGSAGCPYGPTGYEGPGTSFVTDPLNLDTAEVNFAGGLKAGGTAYFSLEGALATAQLSAREGGLATSFTVSGEDYSTKGQAGKQDTGSPADARRCETYEGQETFKKAEALGHGIVAIWHAGHLTTASALLSHFLGGTGSEVDYPDTSATTAEVQGSVAFTAENDAIVAYIKQQLAAGVTQIQLPQGQKAVHALAFDRLFTTSISEEDLYWAFRYTHSIIITGGGNLVNGTYVGSLTYEIGASYGFNKGNTFGGIGTAMRYLQTICGAPYYPLGAQWFPVVVTVTVPLNITAPAPPGD